MQPLIQITNLFKQYKTGELQLDVLKGVELNVCENEFVAMMGPSGSGKSTLMNIIGCLDVQNSGDFLLNGKRVNNLKDQGLAEIRNKQIGFVFQQFHLLPRLTVLENVMLPLIYAGVKASERKQRATAMLAKMQIQDKQHRRSNQLSGGQCQRVAIARALINNPGLLLADEPTGNLDSKTAHEIMQIFKGLHRQGQTIILVTHEDDIAAYANRKIILKDGQIISDITA